MTTLTAEHVPLQLRMYLDLRPVGTCPCCNNESEVLVKHHWQELDGSLHEKLICYSCNGLLSSRRFGMEDHVLPAWPEQVKYVREHLAEINTRVYLVEHPEVARYYMTTTTYRRIYA